MTNKEIQFLLSLRDDLSAKWRTVTDKVTDGAKNMVRQFERHWASISAGAFAAWGAVNKAMDMTESYAKHAQSLTAFGGMVRKVGLDATVEFDKIRNASGGLIDDKALAEAANRAMSLGIPIQNLTGFLEIARAKARDMGTTTADAFNDLVVALGRQSAPILDNLGIIVKTEAANEAYAKSLGKTVSQLTDAEKKQAFMNAALDAGREALTRHNLEVMTFNERIQEARATLENASLWVGQFFARVLYQAIGVFNRIAEYYTEVFSGILFFFATMEAKARQMGLVTSTYFTEAYNTAKKRAAEFGKTASDYLEIASLSAYEFAQAIGGSGQANEGGPSSVAVAYAIADAAAKYASEQAVKYAKTASAELEKVGVKTVDRARDFAEKFKAENVEAIAALRVKAEDAEVSFGEMYGALWQMNGGFKSAVIEGLDAVHSAIVSDIGAAWEQMFGQANSLLEIFIKNFVEKLTSNVVQSAIGGLLSLIPGGDVLAGFFGGIFHQGGTVPKAHAGAYIDAPPSREFPILVRGGETVRTEAQEDRLQAALASSRGSAPIFNLHMNVYGPIADEQTFKDLVERGMRKLGVTDVNKYFRNGRSNLVLEC